MTTPAQSGPRSAPSAMRCAPAAAAGTPQVRIGGAVVVVARPRITNRDDQARVGIGDHLHVRRVAVVLGRSGDGVVAVGTGVPSTIRTVSGAWRRCVGGSASLRAEPVGDLVYRCLLAPEQRRHLPHRQVGSVAGRDQQHPVRKTQAPLRPGRPSATAGPPRRATTVTSLRNWPADNPVKTEISSGRDALSTCTSRPTTTRTQCCETAVSQYKGKNQRHGDPGHGPVTPDHAVGDHEGYSELHRQDR